MKKNLLLIALTLGLFTDLALTNLVGNAKLITNSGNATNGTQIARTRPRLRGGLPFRVRKVRASGNLEAGAARGSCNAQQDITALVPPNPKEKKGKGPVELTLSDRPTFFVNIPKTTAQQAEFLLKDENQGILLRETIDLTANNAVAHYTLPSSFPGLEVGKQYVWRFSLSCDPDDRSGDARTSGLVKRVKPEAAVAQQLARAKSNTDRLPIYANNGYWLETLKVLSDLRAANPNDQTLVQDWKTVFSTAGLGQFASQPVFELKGTPVAGF